MKKVVLGLLMLSSQAFGIWGGPGGGGGFLGGGGGCGMPHFPTQEQREQREEAIEAVFTNNIFVAGIKAIYTANPLSHLDDLGHHADYVKEAHEIMQESHDDQQRLMNILQGNYDEPTWLDRDCDVYFERYVRNQKLAKQAEKGTAILYGAGSFSGPLLAFTLGGYGAFHTAHKDQKSKENLKKYMNCVAKKKEEVDRLNKEHAEDMRRRAEDEEYRKKREAEDVNI